MEIPNEDRRQCCWDLWIARGWWCFDCGRRVGKEDPATFDRGPFGSRRTVILDRDRNIRHDDPLYCLCGWEHEYWEHEYKSASCASCHYWSCLTVPRVLDRFGSWCNIHDWLSCSLGCLQNNSVERRRTTSTGICCSGWIGFIVNSETLIFS